MKKPERFPVIIIEGGLVQGFLAPEGKEGWTSPMYELIDFDMFDGTPAEDIVDQWNCFTPQLQAYIEKFHQFEYDQFMRAVQEIDERE